MELFGRQGMQFGADEHAGGHLRAVGEPQLEAIPVVGEAGEAMAEM